MKTERKPLDPETEAKNVISRGFYFICLGIIIVFIACMVVTRNNSTQINAVLFAIAFILIITGSVRILIGIRSLFRVFEDRLKLEKAEMFESPFQLSREILTPEALQDQPATENDAEISIDSSKRTEIRKVKPKSESIEIMMKEVFPGVYEKALKLNEWDPGEGANIMKRSAAPDSGLPTLSKKDTAISLQPPLSHLPFSTSEAQQSWTAPPPLIDRAASMDVPVTAAPLQSPCHIAHKEPQGMPPLPPLIRTSEADEPPVIRPLPSLIDLDELSAAKEPSSRTALPPLIDIQATEEQPVTEVPREALSLQVSHASANLIEEADGRDHVSAQTEPAKIDYSDDPSLVAIDDEETSAESRDEYTPTLVDYGREGRYEKPVLNRGEGIPSKDDLFKSLQKIKAGKIPRGTMLPPPPPYTSRTARRNTDRRKSDRRRSDKLEEEMEPFFLRMRHVTPSSTHMKEKIPSSTSPPFEWKPDGFEEKAEQSSLITQPVTPSPAPVTKKISSSTSPPQQAPAESVTVEFMLKKFIEKLRKIR